MIIHQNNTVLERCLLSTHQDQSYLILMLEIDSEAIDTDVQFVHQSGQYYSANVMLEF